MIVVSAVKCIFLPQVNIVSINDFIILAGNALKCYQCLSILNDQVELKCNSSNTVECPAGECASASATVNDVCTSAD